MSKKVSSKTKMSPRLPFFRWCLPHGVFLKWSDLNEKNKNEKCTVIIKVIREKSRGGGSLIVQDTIENVSEPKFFFKLFKKKKYIF